MRTDRRPQESATDDYGQDRVQFGVHADLVGIRRPDVRGNDEPAMPAQKPQKAYAKSFTRRSLMPL